MRIKDLFHGCGCCRHALTARMSSDTTWCVHCGALQIDRPETTFIGPVQFINPRLRNRCALDFLFRQRFITESFSKAIER